MSARYLATARRMKLDQLQSRKRFATHATLLWALAGLAFCGICVRSALPRHTGKRWPRRRSEWGWKHIERALPAQPLERETSASSQERFPKVPLPRYPLSHVVDPE